MAAGQNSVVVTFPGRPDPYLLLCMQFSVSFYATRQKRKKTGSGGHSAATCGCGLPRCERWSKSALRVGCIVREQSFLNSRRCGVLNLFTFSEE